MPMLARLLAIIDPILVLFIFFPLSIFHWRGTWQLQDIYFLPGNLVDSSWVSLAIGANLGLVELLTQPYLAGALRQEHKVLYFICSRLHLYIHGWAVMCFWRGVWNLMDLYLTEGWFNSLVILIACQVISFVTRTTRTNVGIPVSIMLDTDPDLLEPDTVFKINPEDSIRYMLDCLFTQFIIIFSSICIWRGIWNIFDAFIFPHRHFMSDVISLVAGLASISTMFILQEPLSWISEKLGKKSATWKLIYEDIIFFIATWANLLLWRGAWDLCINYVIPEPETGAWISHCIGTIGMMSLQVFNNVGLNGIERDGQYKGGEGIFPLYYLRTYLQHKITPGSPSHYKTLSQKDGETIIPMLETGVNNNSNHSNSLDSGTDGCKMYVMMEEQQTCVDEEESFLTASDDEVDHDKGNRKLPNGEFPTFTSRTCDNDHDTVCGEETVRLLDINNDMKGNMQNGS